MWSMDKEWNDRQRPAWSPTDEGHYGIHRARDDPPQEQDQDIDQVARGRIFIAKQALELGLVDEIGGLSAAIAQRPRKAA